MIVSDLLPALEQAAAVLADLDATSVEIRGAAESARASVREADKAIAGHEASEAEIFTAIAPPAPRAGAYRLRARSMRETVDALLAHDRGGQILAAQRKIAVWLGAELDARAREAHKAETARDEARKPFHEQTRRARDLAERIGGYPTLARRLVALFHGDALICKLGNAAESRIPHRYVHAIAMERTWSFPRVNSPEMLRSVRLPPEWTGDEREIFGLGRHFDDDESIDPAIDPALHALRELSMKADRHEIDITSEIVAQTVHAAQCALCAAQDEVVDRIGAILSLDAAITKNELGWRYPDGAAIFDPTLFPTDWRLGMMGRIVKLPSAKAAAPLAAQ